MVIKKIQRPRNTREYVLGSGSTDSDYCKVKNGYFTQANDDVICCLGKKPLNSFIRKVEGHSIENTVSGQGPGKGMAIWINPDPNATDRSHILYALGNQIFVRRNGTHTLLSDVSASFGYTTDFLNGVMRKKNLFLTVGDTGMAAKLLKYDGTSLTLSPQTALSAPRLLGTLDERILSTGVGALNIKVQHSEWDGSGAHGSFTFGQQFTDGGDLSGNIGAVTAMAELGGNAFIFEKDRVTIHKIRKSISFSGIASDKHEDTLLEGGTIEGIGTYSPKGVTQAKNSLFFVDDNGVYQYTSGGEQIQEITKSFRNCFKGSGFNFRDSSIQFDRKRNLLYVTAAQEKDGEQDIIMIYSPETQSWSYDKGKRVNQLIWDDINQKMWGISSFDGDGEFYDVYDEQYRERNLAPGTQDGEEIEVCGQTRYEDGGQKYFDKIYKRSIMQVLHTSSSASFTHKIYINDETCPVYEKEVSLCYSPTECSGAMKGGIDCEVENLADDKLKSFFYQHNTCPIKFNKLSHEFCEKSDKPFLLSWPETVIMRTGTQSCNRC